MKLQAVEAIRPEATRPSLQMARHFIDMWNRNEVNFQVVFSDPEDIILPAGPVRMSPLTVLDPSNPPVAEVTQKEPKQPATISSEMVPNPELGHPRLL